MSEHDYRARGDRRHASLGELVAVFTLVLQVCALVWGAATLTKSVTILTANVAAVQLQLGTMNDRLEQIRTDVRILQDHDTKRQGR